MNEATKEEIRRKVAAIESWYHRIDLGHGLETPGHFRMADYLGHYHFPERMDGMRVLDVGASTGFFAYEFERRGAAEVVAVELPSWAAHDWTPRYRRQYGERSAEQRAKDDRAVMLDGFTVVGEALGSKRVRRIFRPIYELNSDELGTFDLVFSGAMLMHVRDPILGIQRMRDCCKPSGRLIVSISALTGVEGPVARFRRGVEPVQLVADEPRGPRQRADLLRLRPHREPRALHAAGRDRPVPRPDLRVPRVAAAGMTPGDVLRPLSP